MLSVQRTSRTSNRISCSCFWSSAALFWVEWTIAWTSSVESWLTLENLVRMKAHSADFPSESILGVYRLRDSKRLRDRCRNDAALFFCASRPGSEGL